MTKWSNQLYRLLPAVYQIRDADHGEQPLRQLMAVIGEQVQVVQDDIAQLYDNWFIETCDDWVVPYLGDLVGYQSVENPGPPTNSSTSRDQLLNRYLYPRSEIANLVHRRRRKGTLPVLEEVAKDVTGWPSAAVEFGRLVLIFQNVQFPRPQLGRTFCVRSRDAGPRINTPFDHSAYTVDVRAMQSLPGVGWYHPYKVGLFVWRRLTHSLTSVRPCRICAHHDRSDVRVYTFDRLGLRQPLYVRPERETNEWSLAQEVNVPIPLRRDLLRDPDQRHAGKQFYGIGGKSVAIYVRKSSRGPWELIPNTRVGVRDLRNEKRWEEAARQELQSGCADVVVDSECGLLLFDRKNEPCELSVSYCTAKTANLGGGEYARALSIDPRREVIPLRNDDGRQRRKPQNLLKAIERAVKQLDPQSRETTSAALGIWCRSAGADSHKNAAGFDADDGPCDKSSPPCGGHSSHAHWLCSANLCVELLDSDTYEIPANQSLSVADGVTLEIRAANGAWPLIRIRARGDHQCANPWTVTLGQNSRLVFDGLLICGATLRIEEAVVDDKCPPRDESDRQPGSTPCRAGSEKRPTGIEQDLQISAEPSLPALRTVVVRHTTFVPGGTTEHLACRCQPNHASITTCFSEGQLSIDHSIVGTLNLEHPKCKGESQNETESLSCPTDPLNVNIRDSIVDAAFGRPAIVSECCFPAHANLTIERATILGDICVQQIARADDSLFAGVVHVRRRSYGYMRFCYVPTDDGQIPELSGRDFQRHLVERQRCDIDELLSWKSPNRFPYTEADCCSQFRTPPRFKCQPDASATGGSHVNCGCDSESANTAQSMQHELSTIVPLPKFVTTRYGQPGYCELALNCPREILRGAEDESELGAFHDNYWPQRGAALEARIQEYTPADMESAVLYADDLQLAASIHCKTSSHCDSRGC
jgi:hypothetical protein